jgi:hypothetical protein
VASINFENACSFWFFCRGREDSDSYFFWNSGGSVCLFIPKNGYFRVEGSGAEWASKLVALVSSSDDLHNTFKTGRMCKPRLIVDWRPAFDEYFRVVKQVISSKTNATKESSKSFIRRKKITNLRHLI